ncbi:MAG: glycyl-radical enzyme activating protein [Oscillospiraceae bacterium]|nr:glycyl-radical enzyme activating protein [Oscillospiraceae bacterium]
MEQGLISNIQHYSLQDGPGIRTTVFLKGCPLRCRWCCNPETQSMEPETMKGTVTGTWMTVDQVLREVEKDEIFYRHGAGGLTVSGGEPLMQGAFTLALIREAKKRYLSTAMETSGQGDSGFLLEIAGLLDTIYMDIKSMDEAKHRKWTGAGNAAILQNIVQVAYLKQRGRLILRTPVIPGFNDEPEKIEAICQFVETLPPGIGYELLPYHRLGRDKYTGLDRDYPMEDVKLPEGRIETLRAIVEGHGLGLWDYSI